MSDLAKANRYYRILEAELELVEEVKELAEETRAELEIVPPDPALVMLLLQRAEEAYARAGSPPLAIRERVLVRWERLHLPSAGAN